MLDIVSYTQYCRWNSYWLLLLLFRVAGKGHAGNKTVAGNKLQLLQTIYNCCKRLMAMRRQITFQDLVAHYLKTSNGVRAAT